MTDKITITGRVRVGPPIQNILIRTEEGRAIRAAFAKEVPEIKSADYMAIERRMMEAFK